MSSCRAKHATPSHIPDADWKCPKCGATSDPPRISDPAFIVDATDPDAHEECPLLHEVDDLRCGCGYGTTGKAFAAAYRKRKSLVTCPTCKGAGCVPDPRPRRIA